MMRPGLTPMFPRPQSAQGVLPTAFPRGLPVRPAIPPRRALSPHAGSRAILQKNRQEVEEVKKLEKVLFELKDTLPAVCRAQCEVVYPPGKEPRRRHSRSRSRSRAKKVRESAGILAAEFKAEHVEGEGSSDAPPVD